MPLISMYDVVWYYDVQIRLMCCITHLDVTCNVCFGRRKLSTNGTKPRLLMLITDANGSVQRNRFSSHDRFRYR